MTSWLYVIGAILIVCFGFVILRGAPYVPSHRTQLRRAFTVLYPLSYSDVLVDLGSGDGVVLREARRLEAQAIGYELNPFLVLMTRLLSWRDEGIKVYTKDYQRLQQLPKNVTIVYAFTTSYSIESIGKKMQQWSKGQKLYLISYGFRLHSKPVYKTDGPMNLYLFVDGE